MSVDVSLLRQFSTETFTSLLRQIQGEKDLVIEAQLMKPLDKIANMSVIKSCGVNKLFKFDPNELASKASTRIYFISSSLHVAKMAIDQLKTNVSPGLIVYMIFVPRALQSIYTLLEEEGMIEKVIVREFMWQLIPLDADLLSLELPTFFSSSFCHGDLSFLGSVSRSLFNLECLYGHIPNRVGLGKKSSAILKQLEILESNPVEKKEPEIGHLIVMDRDFDFVSCLLSPVAYEALLDEVFGITCGTVNFVNSEAASEIEILANIRLELSSRDKVFENIRFKHFANIHQFLSNSLKQVRQSQSKTASMNVNEMKEFVQKGLKDVQQQQRAVTIHIGASEAIQKEKGHVYGNLLPLEQDLVKGAGWKETVLFLERSMATSQPIELVLRLLCLASCCLNGLSQIEFSKMKKLVCEAYGFQHLVTINALSNMGLLKAKDSSPSAFTQLVQKLDLIPKAEAINSLDRSPSGVFNGIYMPVICKIVKLLLDSPTLLHELTKSNSFSNSIVQCQKATSSKNILIFFVGGYTMAETAALKALQSSCGYRFLIAGTCNITGKSVVSSVLKEKC